MRRTSRAAKVVAVAFRSYASPRRVDHDEREPAAPAVVPSTSNQALARLLAPPAPAPRFCPSLPVLARHGGPPDVKGARPLTDNERAYLEDVYGDALDYDSLQVSRGELPSVGSSRTLGNTMHIEDGHFESGAEDAELTKEGLHTLAHEAGHSLQYQQSGWGYAPRALGAQAGSALRGEGRSGAYEWRERDAEGADFWEWNPEEQAAMAEDYDRLLRQKQAAEERGEALAPDDQAEFDKLDGHMETFKAGPPPYDPHAGTGGGSGASADGGSSGDGGAGEGGASSGSEPSSEYEEPAPTTESTDPAAPEECSVDDPASSEPAETTSDAGMTDASGEGECVDPAVTGG